MVSYTHERIKMMIDVRACFCVGPQNGDPVCPCRMRERRRKEMSLVDQVALTKAYKALQEPTPPSYQKMVPGDLGLGDTSQEIPLSEEDYLIDIVDRCKEYLELIPFLHIDDRVLINQCMKMQITPALDHLDEILTGKSKSEP